MEAGRAPERAHKMVEHEAERGVGLRRERRCQDDGAEPRAVGPEVVRAPGERGERVGLGGAERVLAAGALRGAAGAEEGNVGVGWMDREAGQAEDVGGDGGDGGGGARRVEVDAAGAHQPGERGDVLGLEAGEIEGERVEGLGGGADEGADAGVEGVAFGAYGDREHGWC